MGTLQTIKKRLLQLQGKEGELARAALSENSEVAVDLNAAQLAQGILKDGSLSDFTYASFTIASKKQKSGLSAITDHLTNYDTGESYRNLFMKVEGDQIAFGTTTDKEESISDRMEGKAFGLTPDNKEEFIRQHVQQSFMARVKEIVKL